MLVEPKELDDIAPGRSRTLEISGFVDLDQVAPIFFDKTCYVGPRRKVYSKAYGLLQKALAKANRAGVATFVMRGRQYLIALKAEDGILTLHTQHRADEIRDAPGDPRPTPEDTCPRQRDGDGRSADQRPVHGLGSRRLPRHLPGEGHRPHRSEEGGREGREGRATSQAHRHRGPHGRVASSGPAAPRTPARRPPRAARHGRVRRPERSASPPVTHSPRSRRPSSAKGPQPHMSPAALHDPRPARRRPRLQTAVVIDWTKHCHRLVSVDPARRVCVVEPGIVLDELNRQLSPTELKSARSRPPTATAPSAA